MTDTEREQFVNGVTRYVKTHGNWKSLHPEAAVRATLWLLVSDPSVMDHLCQVWGMPYGPFDMDAEVPADA